MADVDGDGDMDVLSASQRDDKIAWYQNDGYGNFFGSQQVISTAADAPQSFYAADVDGDGDIDVLSASFNDDKIAWYQNDGGGNFGDQLVITTQADRAESVYAADLDNDGDMDVLSASFNDSKIAWYQNNGNGIFGSQRIITTDADEAQSVYAADVDGDGDIDVLSASKADNKIAWYQNDGSGNFGSQRIITTLGNFMKSVYAVDVDGDGDMDVLGASQVDDRIAWYQNDGNENFGTQQLITREADFPTNIYASDVDGDGDIDVLSASASDDKIAWYQNDGNGNFGSQRIITTAAKYAMSVYVADVDGDGDMDVLSASYEDNKIAWYENRAMPDIGAVEQEYTPAVSEPHRYTLLPGTIIVDADFADVALPGTISGTHFLDLDRDGVRDENEVGIPNAEISITPLGFDVTQQVITDSADGAQSIFAVDVDGDGDIDVLSADSDSHEIAWYQNDGNGDFGSQQVITTQADNAQSVYATDVDGDGDMDVLSASSEGDKIAWYQNDGSGKFGSQQVITTQADNAQSVYATDIDSDGDMDVLSASADDDMIAWYQNDGSGNFGDQKVITTEADSATSVYAVDVDGDGDMDVLSASARDDKIAWYQNDGDGNFGPLRVITTNADGAYSVYAVDVDGDGDMDVLSASANDNKIAWYENDGSGNFGTQQVITTATQYATSVYATDLDGDGDMDVLSASFADDKIAWYQNDGSGKFRPQLVITTSAIQASSVYAADVDGDGDMDVLSASIDDHTIAWFENRSNDFPPVTTTTDALGYYHFKNIPVSPTYSVHPVASQGWVTTAVTPLFELLPGGEVSKHNTSSDFDNANISGQIFRDLDVDGVRDAAEVGLEGWTVYIDADHDGVVSSSDPKTTTDSSGHYSFTDLGPFETYTINQLKPTGYVQTDPLAPGGISATLVRDHANSEDFQNLYDLSGTANGDFYFIGRDHDGSGYNSAELFHYSSETGLTQTLTNTNQPQAVTTDGSSAFWIDSDRNGNPVILKREAGGETTTVVYPRTSEDNQLTRPVDIEFLQTANDKDEFLVLDAEEGQLWLLKAGPLANELTKTGGARYASGNSRHHDSSLALDGDTVYVADPGMEGFGDTPSAIESIPLSGSEWTTLYSGEKSALAQGITIGRDKVIFSSADNIYELAKNGGEPTLLVNDERFGSPAGLWFGSETLYAVDSLDLTQATSWEVSFNSATLATADKGWQITPGAGEHITNLGFGNIDTASLGGASSNSNISGRIYQDSNTNSTFDAGDIGLAGKTVYIDLNDNNQFDDGEPAAVTLADDTETEGNEAGTYLFNGLAADNYQVTLIPAGNLKQTSPVGRKLQASEITVGDGPRTVIASDLNADGHPDLILANGNDDNISVLLNDGKGGYTAEIKYTVGSSPSGIVALDYNQDGKLDLAVSNLYTGNLSLLAGVGDGSFAAATTIPTDLFPSSITAVDVNGDGREDLVVTSEYEGMVNIFTATSNGSFNPKVAYSAGESPQQATAIDFDSDGDVDLAVTDLMSDKVTLLTNDGAGVFTAAVSLDTGKGAYAITSGDINGDDRADLIVTNVLGEDISIFLANGSGGFLDAQSISVGKGPTAVELVDIDADNDLDIAVTSSNSKSVVVLVNQGNGTFRAPEGYGVGNFSNSLPFGVTAADLDGNGFMELVVTNSGDDQLTILDNRMGGVAYSVTVDGEAASENIDFLLADQAVPTMGPLDSMVVAEGSAIKRVSLTGITAGVGEDQPLSVTATGSNPSLMADLTVDYSSPASLGMLSLRPMEYKYGSSLITVTVTDGGEDNDLSTGGDNKTASVSFTYTVDEVNDPTTLEPLNNLTITEDAAEQTVSLTGITAGPEETQSLRVSASSSNPTLINTPSVTYVTAASTGSLKFTPIADQSGTATITVTVEDAGLDNDFNTAGDNASFSRSFDVTVTPVNDTPAFASPVDISIEEDAGEQTVNVTGITAGAGETQPLRLTAVSSNTDLIAAPTVVYTDGAETANVKFTSVANQIGTATVTLTLEDGGVDQDLNTLDGNISYSQSFEVTVTSVNDQPTIDAIDNLTVIDEFGVTTVDLAGITAGPLETQQPLRVTATSSNGAVIANPTIVYSSPETTGQLKFTPLITQIGTSTITVSVEDGGLDNDLNTTADNQTTTETFVVTVVRGNESPTLVPPSDISIAEDSGVYTVNLSGITAGDGETQDLRVTAVSANTSLISTPVVQYTSDESTGALLFSPQADQYGVTTITVTVEDGGRDNNLGTTGNNLTISRTFEVEVTPVNDPPTFNLMSDVTVSEDADETVIDLTGIFAGGGENQHLKVTATSSNIDLLDSLNVDYSSANSAAKIKVTPKSDTFGVSTITLQLEDAGLDNDLQTTGDNSVISQTFDYTVNPVNDLPTLDPIDSLVIPEDSLAKSISLQGISAGGGEEQKTNITVGVSDTDLLDSYSLDYTIGESAGSFDFTPAANGFGNIQFTFMVEDAGSDNKLETKSDNATFSRVFDVTISPINDLPTLDAISAVSIQKNSPEQIIQLTGIDAGPSETQFLTVTATSTNPSLINNPTIIYTSAESTATLKFTPTAHLAGVSQITVTVEDAGIDNDINTTADNETYDRVFDITVVQDNPWHNSTLPTDVNEDSSVTPLDALFIINYLNSNGSEPLPMDRSTSEPPFYDVNKDGWISPVDGLQVINILNVFPFEVTVGVQATAADGTPLSTVEVGSLFYLTLTTEDHRENPGGTFAVYADAYYDAQMINVVGAPIYHTPYDNATSVNLSNPGEIDEWGSIGGFESTGAGQKLVSSIPVRATAAGQVLFGVSGADDLPSHDVLVYNSEEPIPHNKINFEAVNLIITDSEGEQGEGEAYFAKSITSSTPDRVITAPAAVQQLLIDDALRSTAAASWAPRYEDDANEKENSWQDSLASVDAFFADDTVDD